MCIFPHFSLTCFDILSWDSAYDFVLMYYRSNLKKCCYSASVWLSVRPSIFCTCLLYQYALSFKFDFGFFNAFLLEKFYIKIAFFNVHDGRIMHRSRCSGIFVRVMPVLELRILEIHNIEYCKYTIIHTFRLHALTYWAEIMYLI